MAKKKPARKKPARTIEPALPPAVTTDRFRRLYRLLSLLHEASYTREQLSRKLDLDVRGFYRDLELLRSVGIVIDFTDGAYALGTALEDARAVLPYPDPRLSFGEVRQLAKGRTRLHHTLQKQIADLLDPTV